MWIVYVLLCQDKSFYTGITNNLEKRLIEHKSGKGGRYTRSHKVVKVVYQEKVKTHSQALKKEAEIKKWGRAKKIKTLNLLS